MPWGICIDRQDHIYVADWGNNRVQKFAPTGELLVKFECSNTEVGSLKGPSGVAVDSDGDVYVTDWGNHRVQIYDPRRPIHYGAGRRRPRSFALGPDLHRRQSGYHQSQAADRSGA